VTAAPAVLLLNATDRVALALLLGRYGIALTLVAPGQGIPGSYWGHSEAGLKGRAAVRAARHPGPLRAARGEPLHLHDSERRAGLDRDAGGTDLEESAVCYLQVLLADEVPGMGRARLLSDMDAWGYSFRLGSTRAWFEEDATDARDWLCRFGVIEAGGRLTGAVRSR